MTDVTGILCQVITGIDDYAGTDGRVYLGIGGREFRLDSTEDDFNRGSDRMYVLGYVPEELSPQMIPVVNADLNSPTVGFQLDTEYFGKSPTYIRFEPQGASPDWNIAAAVVRVYVGEGRVVGGMTTEEGFASLWLGDASGKILFLTRFLDLS